MPRPGTSASTPGWRREDGEVMTGWKLTLPCTRDEAEAIGLSLMLRRSASIRAYLTREPDESRPDEWLLEAYFEGKPDAVAVARIGALSALARRTTSNHWAMRIG